jgi:alpha-1,2-mannosyltransferase
MSWPERTDERASVSMMSPADDADRGLTTRTRFLRTVALAAPPVLAALVVAPFSVRFEGFWPWDPRVVDLEVYRYAGQVLLDGGDILTARTPRDGLAFIYPPFAALLCVPLVAIPLVALKALWLAATAVALFAVLHRFGLTGWPLSLATTACVFFVEPVRETIGFGQVNVFLMAMVVLDLVPGTRLLDRLRERRVLPAGVLTGIAAAIKLTPALFAVHLLLARQWRTARWVALSAVAATVLGALVLPRESIAFWQVLLGGDTRTGYTSFLFNQSILSAVLRFLGETDSAHRLGLVLSACVALLGAWAAALWHRRGQVLFAVSLCGVATLLASPLSWTHHFVWVVPLAFAVRDRGLPPLVRGLAMAFVLWVSAAVFKQMPWGQGVELTYAFGDKLVAAVTPLLGVALVAVAVVTAPRRSTSWTTRPRLETPAVQ